MGTPIARLWLMDTGKPREQSFSLDVSHLRAATDQNFPLFLRNVGMRLLIADQQARFSESPRNMIKSLSMLVFLEAIFVSLAQCFEDGGFPCVEQPSQIDSLPWLHLSFASRFNAKKMFERFQSTKQWPNSFLLANFCHPVCKGKSVVTYFPADQSL